MGKYIRTLTVFYDTELSDKEIPLFRGAVLKALGEQANVLYHNHVNGDSFRYSYPLIQYKRIRGKAAVMGIGKGLEVITQLLTSENYNYQIGKEQVEMRIESVNAYDNEIVLTEHPDFRYRLTNWLPLNSENYIRYQEQESMVDRVQIIEHVLVGNILSFLKGIGVHVDEQLCVSITDIKSQHLINYKKVVLMAFDIEFKTNIQLPQYIGLGKNASVGRGLLTNNI